jgi:hypothetical protein
VLAAADALLARKLSRQAMVLIASIAGVQEAVAQLCDKQLAPSQPILSKTCDWWFLTLQKLDGSRPSVTLMSELDVADAGSRHRKRLEAGSRHYITLAVIGSTSQLTHFQAAWADYVSCPPNIPNQSLVGSGMQMVW